MTSPTALPGAAPRVLREAAGRRALQLALLVGGLLALGFLCGGQAQAADRSESAPAVTAVPAAVAEVTDQVSSSTSASASSSTSTSSSKSASSSASAPTSTSPSPSASASVVHSERVVRPVREVVAAVTDRLAQASAPVPPVSPVVQDLRDLTDLTDLADLRDLSDLPSLPVQTLPVEPLPAPVTQAPRPASPVTASPDGKTADVSTATASLTASYGPVVPALGDAAVARAASHSPLRIGGGHAPAHRAPGGEPSGLLGGASVLDGGGARHGDAHAVTAYHRVPLLLVPGSAVRSDAAETRDRHRDIPVFPG